MRRPTFCIHLSSDSRQSTSHGCVKWGSLFPYRSPWYLRCRYTRRLLRTMAWNSFYWVHLWRWPLRYALHQRLLLCSCIYISCHRSSLRSTSTTWYLLPTPAFNGFLLVFDAIARLACINKVSKTPRSFPAYKRGSWNFLLSYDSYYTRGQCVNWGMVPYNLPAAPPSRLSRCCFHAWEDEFGE